MIVLVGLHSISQVPLTMGVPSLNGMLIAYVVQRDRRLVVV